MASNLKEKEKNENIIESLREEVGQLEETIAELAGDYGSEEEADDDEQAETAT